MSAMDKVRRSREADEPGPQILGSKAPGPQVTAMSEQMRELAEEARRFMDELGEASERRALDWNEAQEAAAATWETTVAERIEPLAQSMVALSNEARASIAQLHANSEAQAKAWSAVQASAAREHADAARQLREAAFEARRAAWAWGWPLWTGVLVAALVPMAVLLIASWLWLPQGWTPQAAEDGSLWLQVWSVPPVPETEPQTR